MTILTKMTIGAAAIAVAAAATWFAVANSRPKEQLDLALADVARGAAAGAERPTAPASSPELRPAPLVPARLPGVLPRRASAEDDPLEAEIDEVVASIAEDFREHETSAPFAATFERLAGQSVESLMRCMGSLMERRTGRLVLAVSLLSEDEGSGLVDTVEVREDTMGEAGTVECIRESVHTLDFAPPSDGVYETYVFTIDGEGGEFSIGGETTPDNVFAAVDRYPGFAREMTALLANDRPLREAIRARLDSDPTLAPRYPGIAAAVQSQ